jgi:hypothetical protein
MPIHIRNFHFRQLGDAKKKENDNMKKNQKSTGSSPKGPNVRVRK